MTQGTGQGNRDTGMHGTGCTNVQLHGVRCPREVNFTQRTEGMYKTPLHRFFQISQSLFSSPVKEIQCKAAQ